MSLCFKPNFHVEILDSEQLVLFSEDQHHLLQGTVYVAIAKIIKNSPILEQDILCQLSKTFPLELIKEALRRLKIKNLISECCSNAKKNILGFWSDLNLEKAGEAKHSIVIKNFSQHNCSAFITSLENLSLNINEFGDFFVVIVDNYICHELALFNKERIKDGKPWMLLKPSGRIIWIGPIFEANRTGCWNCLASKLKENRRVEVDIFGLNDHNLNIPSICFLPTTLDIAMNLAAIEVAKWVRSPQSHNLYSQLLTLDLANMETRNHHFKSLKTCQICQEKFPGVMIKQIPEIKSSFKEHYFEEGERVYSLDKTLSNLNNIVSPLTGIISSIRHSMVNEEHICYAVRTHPLPFQHDLNRCIRIPDVATGKGKTKLQATVGCIAESIERYNCTFSNQKEIRCSYNNIKDSAIHPYALLNFSDTQYENRDIINTQRVGFNKIASPYDGSEIGWTAVYSLTHKRTRYVPSAYCYLHYPYENDVRMCAGSSNGCASGNSLEEAVYYAILELIERDAVAIWWYNRIQRPCVDLSIFQNPTLSKIQANFKQKNRELYVLDLTTDLKIPSYVAVSWKYDGTEIFFGTGAHLQPQVGVSRAISELHQVMIRANTKKNVDLSSISPTSRDLVKWLISESIENHPYLIPNNICKPLPVHSISNDFFEDINTCLKAINNLGLEVFLLDLTNPDINFNTARVIIPGLRHFWSRLGPGRLFETPVQLGWLQKTLYESEMNPIPYFL